MEASHFKAVMEQQKKQERARQQGARYLCRYCLNPIFLDEARWHCVECRGFDCCSSCFDSLRGCEEHVLSIHPYSEIHRRHSKNKTMDWENQPICHDAFVQETGVSISLRDDACVPEILATAFVHYADRPCLGVRHAKQTGKQTGGATAEHEATQQFNDFNFWRTPLPDLMDDDEEAELLGDGRAKEKELPTAADEKKGHYQWYSFRTVYRRAVSFGAGLLQLLGKGECTYRHCVMKLTRPSMPATKPTIGVCVGNEMELYVSIIACIIHGCLWYHCSRECPPSLIRLRSALLPPERSALERAIAEWNVSCVICTETTLPNMPTSSELRLILIPGAEKRTQCPPDIVPFRQVEEAGSSVSTSLPLPRNKPDDVILRAWNGQGDISTHRAIQDGSWAKVFFASAQSLESDISLHLCNDNIKNNLANLCRGGRVGFASNNAVEGLAPLLEDLAELRPSCLVFDSAICSKLHQEFNNGLAEKINAAQQLPMDNSARPVLSLNQRVEMTFLREFCHVLGPRIAFLALTGTMGQDQVKFMHKCFGPGAKVTCHPTVNPAELVL